MTPYQRYLQHSQGRRKPCSRRSSPRRGVACCWPARQCWKWPSRRARPMSASRGRARASACSSSHADCRRTAAARAPAAAGSHDARGGPAAGESPPAESRWEVVQKPGISFADIAGLTEVKDLILRRVLLPFRNPQLAEAYRRKPGGGVLMFGPPGTGKTMMGKAVATELDAPFFNVRCSDIMSKWVGEAEGNVKSLFQAARAKLPAAPLFRRNGGPLFSRRGSQASVMDRVVPEFFAQIDGLQHGLPDCSCWARPTGLGTSTPLPCVPAVLASGSTSACPIDRPATSRSHRLWERSPARPTLIWTNWPAGPMASAGPILMGWWTRSSIRCLGRRLRPAGRFWSAAWILRPPWPRPPLGRAAESCALRTVPEARRMRRCPVGEVWVGFGGACSFSCGFLPRSSVFLPVRL